MENTFLKEFYDYVFVSDIFLDENDQFFIGGAELHLKNIIDTVVPSKILVIQRSRIDDLIKKDNLLILKVKAKNIFIYKLKLAFILNKVCTKIIHFNYIGLDFFVVKRRNIRYTATFHGTGWDFPTKIFDGFYMENTLVNKIKASIAKLFYILEQNSSLRKLDAIISVDTSLTRYAQMFMYEMEQKITVIYNFVDLNKFNSLKNINSDNLRNIITIFYPRNISYARGVNLLIPVAKILKENGISFVIKIAGASINHLEGSIYEKKLVEDIKRNKLQDNFKLIGRISNDKMPQEYNTSDIIIIPSMFSEGTSLSCLEGMVANKIVLGTNIGGLCDLIMDNYNGFLGKTNPVSLATKLLYIINNFEKLSYIKTNARNIIDKVNTLDIWRLKIKDFFKNENIV